MHKVHRTCSPLKPGSPSGPFLPGFPGSPPGPFKPGGPADPLAPLGPGLPVKPTFPLAPMAPGDPLSPLWPGGPYNTSKTFLKSLQGLMHVYIKTPNSIPQFSILRCEHKW